MSRQGLYVPNFWCKGGGIKNFGTHITGKPPRYLVHIVFWSSMGPNGPIMPIFGKQNASFVPNLTVFGPKILVVAGVSKSFGTHITENHLGTLFALVFGQALDQMGQICRYLAKNASFGPNSNFGPKFRFLPNDTKFCQRFVCSPQRDSPFRTLRGYRWSN